MIVRLPLFFILLVISKLIAAWGFMAHRYINVHAVFLLPQPIFHFYRHHISDLEILATKADQRRYSIDNEGVKHFIDLDYYEQSSPLDTINREYYSLLRLVHPDSVVKHGILPWNLKKVYNRLVSAMKFGNSDQIVRLSADLGHYLADAHVPLHTTANYNGQLSNQHGIHALWESRLPEIFIHDYSMFLNKASYIENIDSLIWLSIEESYALKNKVLATEKQLFQLHSDQKYGFELKNNRQVKMVNEAYAKMYHDALSNMVETRMQLAVQRLSCLWFSAWVDAGKPPLNIDITTESFNIDHDSIVLPVVNDRTVLH